MLREKGLYAFRKDDSTCMKYDNVQLAFYKSIVSEYACIKHRSARADSLYTTVHYSVHTTNYILQKSSTMVPVLMAGHECVVQLDNCSMCDLAL